MAITPGMHAEASLTVEQNDTAAAQGSGNVPTLSTPCPGCPRRASGGQRGPARAWSWARRPWEPRSTCSTRLPRRLVNGFALRRRSWKSTEAHPLHRPSLRRFGRHRRRHPRARRGRPRAVHLEGRLTGCVTPKQLPNGITRQGRVRSPCPCSKPSSSSSRTTIQRGLLGPILTRFEQRGFRILALNLLVVPKAMAEKHYAVHQAKPFFGDLVNYISSDRSSRWCSKVSTRSSRSA